MAHPAQRQIGLAVGLCLSVMLGLPAQLSAGWRCDSAQPGCHSVFIVRNWWHAAIVLRRGDIPEEIMPELNDLPRAQMIEFSWGDRDYFPDPEAGVFTALKAGFWSSGSVLHLVAFDGAAESFYRDASITELRLSEEAFARLLAFLDSTFARADRLHAAAARPGLYPYSRFYDAAGKFSVLRSCNTWVAEALQSAGLPVDPSSVVIASNLNRELADLDEHR
ncbi:MAG: DUF2459 domain-containing protein [Candidatus Binatia bacterium]